MHSSGALSTFTLCNHLHRPSPELVHLPKLRLCPHEILTPHPPPPAPGPTIYFLFSKFIYLFLAALGLCCCTRASPCGGFSFLLRSTGSRRAGFSSCGARASVVVAHGLSCCDLPGSGLKPVSPALAGGFLTTAPPGKPRKKD